ncbi:hypothetical protein SPHINGO8BC_150714 [Sphingobacterium multivorum]|uniref:Uncharacterized protein n=1 Tax=Sphingobacterium multivorum TaxID=28454 RepID=A0A654B0Q7_SPHMU|nr:hypothetical protein SPHINGO8BC_150714 [Sphingobacterium multivorum]
MLKQAKKAGLAAYTFLNWYNKNFPIQFILSDYRSKVKLL